MTKGEDEAPRRVNGTQHDQIAGSESDGSKVLQEIECESRRSPPASVAIPKVIEAMLEHPLDSNLQTRALVSLKRMTSTEKADGRKLLGEHGGIGALVATLVAHVGDAKIVSLSCMVLANATFENHDNQARFRRARAGEAVTEVMRRHIENAKVQACACLAIRNASSSDDGNQKYLVSVGSIQTITDALKRWGLVDKVVAEHGCAALGNLARGGLTCQAQVRLAGGNEQVINCLRGFNAGTQVVRHCLTAVRNMVVNNEKNQRQIGELGGVEIVVRVLAEYEKDLVVFKRGCEVIRYLAFVEENRDRLRDCGGALTIAKCLSEVKERPKVVVLAFQALSNMCYGHEGNKMLLIDSSGLSAIPRKLGEGLGEIEVEETGLLLLRNLSNCNLSSRKKLVAGKVDMLAIEIMKKREDSPKVTEHALALLLNLSEYQEDVLHPFVSDKKNVDLIMGRMDRFSESVGLDRIGEELIKKVNAETDSGQNR